MRFREISEKRFRKNVSEDDDVIVAPPPRVFYARTDIGQDLRVAIEPQRFPHRKVMPHETTTFCRICEAQCGLTIRVEGERITAVRPDQEHVVSRGYVCVKGLNLENVRASPDRLLYPLKKVDGRYERISWEQALGEIGDKVRDLRTRHGNDSVGLYFGNPVSFSLLVPLMIAGFVRGLGTSKFFNTGSLDCNNKFAVSERMYGAGMALTFPDIDRTKFLMVIGGNPAVSRTDVRVRGHLPVPHPSCSRFTTRSENAKTKKNNQSALTHHGAGLAS